MTTVKALLFEAKKSLQDAKIPSYSLDADLLMANVLGITREAVFCRPEKELSQEDAESFKAVVKRRSAREPMAHILGVREFWGREFKVTADTLDPRPDSEALIEEVLSLYKDREKPRKVIDFGTGTGCLLLTLLAEFKEAEGVAVDISEAALAVAKENSVKLELAKRTSFVVSNWGKEIKGKYDLIISNPPYIKKSDIEYLEPEVAKYEPKGALDGGESGLECYRQLAQYIAAMLSQNGFAVLEYGEGQQEEVRTILENSGLKFVAYKKDLSGIKRCITVKR